MWTNIREYAQTCTNIHNIYKSMHKTIYAKIFSNMHKHTHKCTNMHKLYIQKYTQHMQKYAQICKNMPFPRLEKLIAPLIAAHKCR